MIEKHLDTIIRGDCLEVLKGFPDASVDCVITSPPYPGNEKMWGELYQEDNWEQAHDFLGEVWVECIRVLKSGCKLCINIANTNRKPYLPNAAIISRFLMDKIEPKGEIIWNKGIAPTGTAWGSYCSPSDPSLADQHEIILIFRKKGDHYKPEDFTPIPPALFMEYRRSIWAIAPAKAKIIGHPAPFPIDIPIRLITLYTFEGEIVLDPFMGSGQTALACLELKRRYIGIESEAEWVELAEQRIENNQRQLELF